MKKYIFLILTAAFVIGLSSCEEQKAKKEKKNTQQKERYERRW